MKFTLYIIAVIIGAVSLDVDAASVLRLRPSGFVPNGMYASFRAKRMPDQLVSEYYGQPPINAAMPVLPLMTSHTAGTTDYLNEVPTPDCTTCGGEYGLFGSGNTQEETNENVTEEVTATPVVTITPEPTYTTQKSKTKTTKRKPKPVAPKDEDEEEDENDWPFAQAEPRKKVPSYNVFFPMMFGYPGSFGRSGNEDAAGYGGTAAIANSFSTGAGGVATSHATAFGSPSSSHRNSNWKRKSQTED
ncbi:uncharacterized protein CBL_13883 [Carabus blaptoides fortunei]